jgi:hypothetical protein
MNHWEPFSQIAFLGLIVHKKNKRFMQIVCSYVFHTGNSWFSQKLCWAALMSTRGLCKFRRHPCSLTKDLLGADCPQFENHCYSMIKRTHWGCCTGGMLSKRAGEAPKSTTMSPCLPSLLAWQPPASPVLPWPLASASTSWWVNETVGDVKRSEKRGRAAGASPRGWVQNWEQLSSLQWVGSA